MGDVVKFKNFYTRSRNYLLGVKLIKPLVLEIDYGVRAKVAPVFEIKNTCWWVGYYIVKPFVTIKNSR